MTSPKISRAELMVALETGDGALERLSAVIATVSVASVVVVPAAGREMVAGDVVALVAAGRKAGCAVLLAGDARLARTVGADGLHLGVSSDVTASFQEARAIVGGRSLVGADAGRSRDDAMTLGELGADYVAFGIPAFVKERDTAFDRQLDLVEWWAEIFEIPCVAMDAQSAAHAGALAAAGADFVCLRLAAGMSIADAAATARDWTAAMADGGGAALAGEDSA